MAVIKIRLRVSSLKSEIFFVVGFDVTGVCSWEVSRLGV